MKFFIKNILILIACGIAISTTTIQLRTAAFCDLPHFLMCALLAAGTIGWITLAIRHNS